MEYLLNSKSMYEVDQYTINKMGIPAIVLMERAATAVVEVMKEHINIYDKVLVVCGIGNNGGDGVAIARILLDEGIHADIRVIGDEKRASDGMKMQLQIARNFGIKIDNNLKISEYTVIVDALFGIGLSKPVSGVYEDIIDDINLCKNTVFSVDIPSGVNADNGKVETVAIHADYTITFGWRKLGLLLYPGSDYAGKTIIKKIGFPEEVQEVIKSNTFTYTAMDLRKLPRRINDSNKGDYGHVLVIAGAKNMSGACYLSAKAACRTGAGLVKILTMEDNRTVLQTTIPEAILSTYEPLQLKNKADLERIIKELDWADSVVIGPGMGISPTSKHMLDIVIEHAKVPVIADADALHLLASDERYVAGKGEKEECNKLYPPENLILTPHLKEMSDLLGCTVDKIKNNLVSRAVSSVKGKHCILAMKDARTVVTDGDRIYINSSGNNGMATAGAGDVLTGIIAALAAQGLNRFEAASLGVYIHGLAGDKASEIKGRYGLIASDIVEAIPAVLMGNFWN